MYSLIGFSNSLIVEAYVLKATRNQIRAVVPGLDDTIQLKRVGAQWISETGERVTLEFLASDDPKGTTSAESPLMTRAAS